MWSFHHIQQKKTVSFQVNFMCMHFHIPVCNISLCVQYVCVLTGLLHYLKCLALCWPTHTKFVLSFNQVLFSHIKTLLLSIFFLAWLKGSGKEEMWSRTCDFWLSLSAQSPLNNMKYLLKLVVLLETCRSSSWVDALPQSLFSELSFFSPCTCSPTHTHIYNTAVIPWWIINLFLRLMMQWVCGLLLFSYSQPPVIPLLRCPLCCFIKK